MEKSFTFTTPDAIEIAYIVQRSQDNPQFMHDMLLHARTLERLLCSSKNAKTYENLRFPPILPRKRPPDQWTGKRAVF